MRDNVASDRRRPDAAEIRLRKIFAADENVYVVYDMVTSTPAGTVPIAEVFEVRAGKITSSLAFFDPRPFVALFESTA